MLAVNGKYDGGFGRRYLTVIRKRKHRYKNTHGESHPASIGGLSSVFPAKVGWQAANACRK